MSKPPANPSQSLLRVSGSFRIMAEAATPLIWLCDPDQSCTYFNQAWQRFTGQSCDEALGVGWRKKVHPDDIAKLSTNRDKDFKNKSIFSNEYRLLRSDGEYRWVVDNGAPLFDENKTLLGYVGSVTDIHESKVAQDSYSQLQKQLFQAQKMEALGQFSARIAHDLNNVISVIRGHIQILGRPQLASDKFQRSIDMALLGCDQGASLIQDLLCFGSPAVVKRTTVSARELAQKAVEFISNVAEKNVSFEVQPGGESNRVNVDANQLMQVFTNLFINAQHAMQGSGQILISFGDCHISVADTPRPGISPGHYMEIAVADTGKGIAPENLKRIFEPFFTTKPPGEGTGLGLAVAYSIVQNHGGWIEACSLPNSGACLKIFLPTV